MLSKEQQDEIWAQRMREAHEYEALMTLDDKLQWHLERFKKDGLHTPDRSDVMILLESLLDARAKQVAEQLLTKSAPQLEAFKVLTRWLAVEYNLHLLDTGAGAWGVGFSPPDGEKTITYHGNLSLAVEDALQRVKSLRISE